MIQVVTFIFRKIKTFIKIHERRISSIALLTGFIFDYLTLTRIDRLYDNFVLIFYLIVAALGILILHLYESGRVGGKVFSFLRAILPTVIQFAFGGLFSGFSVFYSRSATLSASWLFLLVIFGLLVGNEFFKRYYARLTFQVTVFFFAVFSYSIFSVPIITRRLGSVVFLLSGAVSLAVILIFLMALARITPVSFNQSKRTLLTSIGAVYFVINIFYFLNIIPPIPLSLQEISVYHFVSHNADGTYTVHIEDRPWYAFLQPKNTFHVTDSKTPSYVLSSIFAPTNLKTNIIHEWQYFDETKDEWVLTHRVAFEIVGGRSDGFRGYSVKNEIFPARWRVNVKTPRGQLVGRYVFRVKQVDEPPKIEVKIL